MTISCVVNNGFLCGFGDGTKCLYERCEAWRRYYMLFDGCFNWECPCGASGSDSELSFQDAEWYICFECGRDVRPYGQNFKELEEFYDMAKGMLGDDDFEGS